MVQNFYIDTIKTRFQSRAGFKASGGFRGIYSGLLSAVIGSAPNGEFKNKFPFFFFRFDIHMNNI